jgi:hypothetical protein
MAKSILELTRGIPKTDREWMDVFKFLNKFFSVSGNELQIGGDIQLPEQSVGTQEIEDLAVTDEKLRASQACSVIGRPQNSAGSPTDIQASLNRHYLRRSGDVVGFGAIEDADLPTTIARDSEVADAITAHVDAVDSHTQYTTATELASATASFPAQTTGTYTATLTGCTTSPTITVRYVITGLTVTLYIPSVNATSNATSCTLTGAPAEIRPTRDQGFHPSLVQDNGVLVIGLARMLTTGTIDLRPGAPFLVTSWTALGTKGIDHINLTYNLD